VRLEVVMSAISVASVQWVVSSKNADGF